MASNLAPVYLDDARVTLQGDPRPQVSKILQAGGHPASVKVLVVRLREAAGADGHPLALDDVIDREKAITPVYLRILDTEAAPSGTTHAAGDMTRGTEAISPTTSGEASARKGASERFAEAQSFADPAHRRGSPRVAQGTRPSASEDGAPTHESGQTVTRTTSRGTLENASEEE
ncbi:MAG TPA: hypothetical protein VM327_09905 [Candidatus Thermoplasmatota archaeon]|nr:hypothetical protein [Candidatus Thermoplasmatota archaeon]